MSVNVNTVYTTVQAILNKEQRGYVAPFEFNKYAEQSQLEIFESYFFDDAHYQLNPKGMAATSVSNIKKILQEKIDVFSVIGDATFSTSAFTLPSDIYRLGTVYQNDGTTTRTIPEIPKDQLQYVLNSKLTEPSVYFPKFIRLNATTIRLYPSTINDGVEVHYIKRPASPIWGYESLGVGRIPLYNVSTSTDFELHDSEQYLLVEKILLYAGVQIKQIDISQFAAQEVATDNVSKKQ